MTAPDQSIRVLVVEDNSADALLIERSLAASQREGFTCRTVDLLETALSSLKSEPPDIVLLDLSFPDSSGIAACERIQLKYPTVPIVVLTGLDAACAE